MAYAAWSVTFGEQPTASKWNILGTNDASFNDGTGIAAAAIVSSHLDANLAGGWIAAGETWTYASADAPTFTFTISGDKTTKYSAGMKIKLTQTTVKYFIITAVSYSAPNTTVTVYGGTDYTLANAAITSPYFALAGGAPYGFPMAPDKWTETYELTTLQNASSATAWVNPGTALKSIPIGCWRLGYYATVQIATSTTPGTVQVSLSTANNSESDALFTACAATQGSTNNRTTMSIFRTVSLAAKTTYYLIAKSLTGTLTVYFVGDDGVIRIEALCAYL